MLLRLSFFLAVEKGTKILRIGRNRNCQIRNYPGRSRYQARPLQAICRPKSNCKKFNWIQARHQYAPGLNYAICLKRPQSACQVTFTQKEEEITQNLSCVILVDFQVTYRRDISVAAFATSVGKAQPQDEYKVNCETQRLKLSSTIFTCRCLSVRPAW